MDFIWSDDKNANDGERELWKSLKLALMDEEGVCYYRYPVFTADKSRKTPDIMILHRHWGLFIIKCLGCNINNIKSIDGYVWEMKDWVDDTENPYVESEDQLVAILSKFRSEHSLRKQRSDVIKGHIFIALPFVSHHDFKEKGLELSPLYTSILFQEDLEPLQLKKKLRSYPKEETPEPLTDEQWKLALGMLQGIPVLRREPRHSSKNKGTKSAMLQKVEQQMQLMDRDQHTLAVQIPPGPQRIRGLSGSGKTIVLCMKAAWMHSRYPEWDIVYTFYTQSLYSMIKNLITRFYRYWSVDEDLKEPNWDKLKVLHGWGGASQPGFYTTVASSMGMSIRTYSEAKDLFSFKHFGELLGKCCQELLNSKNTPQIFDAILIDEGQDFHFSFYKLCLETLKEPKRLIWAYDEVQSLETLAIPTTADIFGENEDGTLKVSLDGNYADGEIEKDVILYRCYRTPRPVLVAAHMFGMGLLRPEGAVQFIPKPGGWEDIGYEIVSGSFNPNDILTIRRPEKNSPHGLEREVGYSNLVTWRSFTQRDDEIEWVASQITENIKKDELKPEDILVITFDWKRMNNDFLELQRLLKGNGIDSIRPGHGYSRSEFQVKGNVTLSGIFPAKGNEASFVYLLGFEQIGMNEKLIVQERNQAFTAMTRTRGWVTITGIGSRADKLFKELEVIMRNPDEISFKVPHPSQIQRNLDNLEYERKRNLKSKADRLMIQLRRILNEIDDPALRKELIDKLQR